MTTTTTDLAQTVTTSETYTGDDYDAAAAAEARRDALALTVRDGLLAAAPTLAGSEKQITWATDLRARTAEALGWLVADEQTFPSTTAPTPELVARAVRVFATTEATDWIDARTLLPTAELVHRHSAPSLRYVLHTLERSTLAREG